MEELYKNGLPNVQAGRLWSPLAVYKERSVMDIIGKPCGIEKAPEDGKSWADTARTISIYNNPRYETARYLIVTDGRFTDQIAVSSQIPASTSVYPHTWMLNRLREQCERNGSFVLFSHNHPSGFVIPSDNDISVTKFLSSYFVDNHARKRFLGHIITGASGASFTDSRNDPENWKGIENGGTVRLAEMRQRPANTGGLNITGSLGNIRLLENMTKINSGAKISTEEYSFACYSDIAGFVTGIKPMPNEWFWSNQKAVTDDINRCAKESGATKVCLVILGGDRHLFDQVADYAARTKKISNAILPDGRTFPENLCSESIFQSGETVPLKIDDSREIRQKIKRQKQIARNNAAEHGYDR